VDGLTFDKMNKCLLPTARALLCREITQPTKLFLPELMQSLHHFLQDWSILQNPNMMPGHHDNPLFFIIV
jgi:hypothetical protein